MNVKMPIYHCTCGQSLLIVPDILEMEKAIRDHLIEHKKVTGEALTELDLTEKVIACLNEELGEESLQDQVSHA